MASKILGSPTPSLSRSIKPGQTTNKYFILIQNFNVISDLLNYHYPATSIHKTKELCKIFV